MNENEINKNLSEGYPALNEERNEMTDINMESAPQSPNLNGGRQPKEGVTFNWTNLLIGAFLFFGLFNGSNIFTDDWTFYIYLAVVVIIHELGHVIMGKSFGCFIQEMQQLMARYHMESGSHSPGRCNDIQVTGIRWQGRQRPANGADTSCLTLYRRQTSMAASAYLCCRCAL